MSAENGHGATIWVDADATPGPVKDILFRTARNRRLVVVLVANQMLPIPQFNLIRRVVVEKHPDAADHYIVEHSRPGDLVITADIPLAAELVPKGVAVISPRGEVFDPENIRQRLNTRDLMASLRDAGVVTGGPSSFSDADRRTFANALDRWITQRSRSPG